MNNGEGSYGEVWKNRSTISGWLCAVKRMYYIDIELKSLRSLVRVYEIQAALREQRILFLRQQIKELEELKKQNSFMA